MNLDHVCIERVQNVFEKLLNRDGHEKKPVMENSVLKIRKNNPSKHEVVLTDHEMKGKETTEKTVSSTVKIAEEIKTNLRGELIGPNEEDSGFLKL
jgi:hypothetical protein